MLVGGFGFIGKHVTRLLSGSAYRLSVFSRPQTDERNRSFAKAHNVRTFVGNITDAAGIRELLKAQTPNTVVHLAALTGLLKCNSNPALAFETNVYGTYNVVMACVASKAKLVFLSSREVYGENTGPTAEDAPLLPGNTYGLTKLLAEKVILWAASKFALDYTVLRLTNVYGPEGDQYNIQAMIKTAMTRGSIPVFGGAQQMNFVYVEDVAQVIRLCLENSNSSGQILNVGSQDNVTVEQVVSDLCSELATNVKVERKPMREGETLNFRPDIQKMERVLGYAPATPFRVGLHRTVDWYTTRG